jgi:FkbM family methyltransferase
MASSGIDAAHAGRRRALKDACIHAIPLRLHLPLRYWYRRMRRRIEPELRAAVRVTRPGSTAIDVGANYGVYTYALARAGARVEAFEPIPECLRVLTAYRSPRVRVHATALSSTNGSADLHIPVLGARQEFGRASLRSLGTEYRTLRVPLRQLDEFGFSDVSLIKIDVEGHEMDVLQGARETIANSRPVLVVEVDDSFLSYPAIRVFETIHGFDYAGFFLWQGQARPVDELPQVPRGSHGVHNFVFLPNDGLAAAIARIGFRA